MLRPPHLQVLLSKRVMGNVNFRGLFEFPGGKARALLLL